MVKVSDFGSARVVRREGERQPTNISGSDSDEENDHTPLLAADLLMTRDTGTILWRAPEIFALQRYGTSADVYRYTFYWCILFSCPISVTLYIALQLRNCTLGNSVS